MAYVLIVHRVADFPAWKRVFDDAADLRQAAGERAYQVLREESDENLVVHYSRWTSTDAARRFFESDDLVRIRKRAGVQAPAFHYLDEVDAGEL